MSDLQTMREYLTSLTVTQGEFVGQKLKLTPWEEEFLAGLLDPSTRVAALTMGRGGGKSTFLGGLASGAFVGPLHQPRGDVVVIAGVLNQAGIVFSHAKLFIPEVTNKRRYSLTDNSTIKEVKRRDNETKLRALASNPDFAHGLAPLLIICDEPAKWSHTTAKLMWSALKTSLGKIPNSKIVAIGTIPADPTHWFSRLFEGETATRHAMKFQAEKAAKEFEDVILDESEWHKANPSLHYMPSLLKTYREEAADAMLDPDDKAQFLALRLNLGTREVDDIDMLIPVDRWIECHGHAMLQGPYILGLDLGGSGALSGAVGYWPKTRALRARAACGDNPNLTARGKADGVGDLYVQSERSRELLATPGRIANVGMLLDSVFLEWGLPSVIMADSYRQAELLDLLEKKGPGYAEIPIEFRNPGYAGGSEDVRLFRDAALTGRLQASANRLLDVHVGNAVVATSGTQCKLAKKTEGGRAARTRDDLAAATILAVAQGMRIGADVREGSLCEVV